MSVTQSPWDQRLARVMVRSLVRTPITPNQLTIVSLLVSVLGAVLLSTGDPALMNWGAGVFVVGRFLDHFDGELARATGRTSRVGYYLDYIAGSVSYVALFTGAAFGIFAMLPEGMALLLGVIGGVSAIAVMVLDFRLDSALHDGSADGYPAWGGFELEDGIYLLAPITWLGFLHLFFVLAAAGAAVYGLWTITRVLRIRRRGH